MASAILLCLPPNIYWLGLCAFASFCVLAWRPSDARVSEQVGLSGTLKNMDVFAERTRTYSQRVPDSPTCSLISTKTSGARRLGQNRVNQQTPQD
jgi:hypothetical protein